MADRIALAREQAERSGPSVRAVAFLRIARVEMVTDSAQARRTFERGWQEARRLTGHQGESLREHARLLAAAAAPDLIHDLPAPRHGPPDYWPERLGRTMLDHGHGDAAFDYVMQYRDPPTFPFPVVSALLAWYGDDQRRLALLRHALAVWSKAPSERFLWLFQNHWRLLPAGEAAEVVREIVRLTLKHPDRPITAHYGDDGAVEIASQRQNTLFLILSVMRHVDAPLAESLISRHEQLAAAARRYPRGLESLAEEVDAASQGQAAEKDSSCLIGSSHEVSYLMALQHASQDGDFAAPMAYALERYREDAAPDNPNQAPREFWPSACTYRGILYHAGIRLGENAAVYLDQIPDPDLRLFAEIELAAALAGLPELQGMQMEQHRRPRSWTRRK